MTRGLREITAPILMGIVYATVSMAISELKRSHGCDVIPLGYLFEGMKGGSRRELLQRKRCHRAWTMSLREIKGPEANA